MIILFSLCGSFEAEKRRRTSLFCNASSVSSTGIYCIALSVLLARKTQTERRLRETSLDIGELRTQVVLGCGSLLRSSSSFSYSSFICLWSHEFLQCGESLKREAILSYLLYKSSLSNSQNF